MEPTQVILKPLVTEKSAWAADRFNRYAFEVHPTANKHQIREAIRSIYNVRVERVATQKRLGKSKPTRYGLAKGKDWKRALVQLHPEDRIELI